MAYIRLDPPQSTPGPSSNPEASTHLTPFDRGTRAIGKALPAHLSPEIQARGLAAARRARRCAHVMPNGHRCGSAALRDRPCCYYHDYVPSLDNVHFPSLDDPLSVQAGLRDVLNGVISGAIPLKDAAILLYGFQIASANVSQISRLRRLTAAEPEQATPLAELEAGRNSDELQ